MKTTLADRKEQDMSLHTGLVVREARTPARYRPMIVKTDTGKFVYFGDLLQGLFVGDIVTWASFTGHRYTTLVVGATSGALKVLLDNWIVTIELESIIYVNDARVVDNLSKQTIADVEAEMRKENIKRSLARELGLAT